MKPCEEMHAAVEEGDLDPCDLYTDLGTLIVEGRVPGISEKGFGEGPHCSSQNHGQSRHQCDPSSPECQKYEQILKHMLLLWKNGIPMTIEVLLYPNCCVPFQNVDSVPDMPYILLEQWTIHMLPRRVPDASISPRGLVQAVRSFLYFSQLCAWYSLTGGKSPQNVHYRVCVPGEAFSSKFSSQPDCHMFPVANIGRSAAMKVLMKCLPRCGEIPSVQCRQHYEPALPLKALKRTAKVQELGNPSKSHPGPSYPIFDGILPTGMSSRTSSPADSMLSVGESLLDPPNSLCMYPKRYQSPSRCGSPSVEVPEHLMFGKAAIKLEEEVVPRRSRPQRRPVVERFLKKDLGNPLCGSSELKSRSEKRTDTKEKPPDILSLKREAVLNYCCIEESMKHVPKEEMDRVLESLRDRHSWRKCMHAQDHKRNAREARKANDFQSKPLEKYFEELKIGSGILDRGKNASQNYFVKVQNCDDGPNAFRQPSWLSEGCGNKTDCDKTNIPGGNLARAFGLQRCSMLRPPTKCKDNFKENQTQEFLVNKLNFKNHSYTDYTNINSIASKSTIDHGIQKKYEKLKSNTYQSNYDQNQVQQIDLHPKIGTVNIKKYGAFLPAKSELTDERELPVLEKNDLPEVFLDGETNTTPEVPSAEKKAIFRRSLDSATSLVFHKRSGLPLTSSPAPIRKSGTCFDFDSTLTSVSAIKRALFEKENEQDNEEKNQNFNLDISAPASIFSSSLLGTFEESVLNGRLEPVSTVEGFIAEIGASGSFCPRHIRLPVTVFFYTLHDMDKVTSPYMGHIDLRNKDYHVPKKGTVQVTLFNPHDTVVKMFVIRYDLQDMPVNCQTFLRQRTLYMPCDAVEGDEDAQKWLRYLIHLRFMSSKSGRIYLHTDIRIIVFRKSDLDAATVHGQRPYELRTFSHEPQNPKFSPHKL